MAPEAKKLLDEALRLPQGERARLAASLIDSLDGETEAEVERAWAEEVERRARDIDAGKAKPVPWAEARRAILANK
jgi:putative addiction module component (TIGR02574 family)